MFSSFTRGSSSAVGGDSSLDLSPSGLCAEEVDVDEVLCAVEFGRSEGGATRGVGAGVSVVGVCVFDRQSFKIQVCEFSTTNDLAVLEGLLLQVRPSCVISTEAGGSSEAGDGWRKKLEDLVASCDADFVRVKRNTADTASLHEDLATLLIEDDSIKNHISRELQLKTACGACAALLSHARLLSDDMYIRQCTLEMYPLDSYLRIDNAAAAALYLFPSAQQKAQQLTLLPVSAKAGGSGASRASSLACALSAGGGISSVFALMSRWCTSQLGSRRLFTCMSQPLVDREKIERRYDIVELFQTDEAFRRQVFCSHFKHVFDLDRLAGRFHRLASSTKDLDANEAPRKKGSIFARVKLTLEDLVKLYDCAVECTSLEAALRGYSGVHRDALAKAFSEPLAEIVKSFATFINLVEFTIDMDEAKRGVFVISRRFEPELAALLDKKEDLRRRMERERQKAEDEIPFSGRKRDAEIVKLIEDNTMGFVLRVTKKDQPAVLGARGRYHQVRLNKSEFIFTTAELRGLCREFKDVSEAYEEMQKSLVEKALLVAASYWPLVERLAELLGMLDVLGAFAAAANAAPIPYVRPKIVEDESGLVLKASRHPLLEIQPGSSSFISNDVHLDPTQRLIIITGPNMGGKSTYIRQVALAVLLAQMGSFVPCDSCQLPIFKQVICRVGASDIQLRGVSTFLAEMVEASAILRNADTKSLVVIDELGRGTSTYEGFGLAWAIAKHLASEVKCLCLFATHFHEMGQLSEEVHGVSNVHVSAAVNKETQQLAFLYRLEPGCIDQSYGVHVASFAGLPASVVERARKKSAELEAVERSEKERRDSNAARNKRTRGEEDNEGGDIGAEGEERAGEREDEGGRRERKNAFRRLTRTLKELFDSGDSGQFVEKVAESRDKIHELKEAAAPQTWKELDRAPVAVA
ncbi:DNA mismatch repair protein mutS, related [Neospora caninum Liverpool]|uniref:DNA mismatch repair protein mutS, related n=1 Tax=Neospora caninum (strain Liverpool) TaxID=572307 RepID=F0VGJ5_NEOCL|nr:DNA mismatch repair protein mutS, related [Neospora caninum Liverpool]CBZ52839.1 DNA mismatch repair protein mutS, related [Neospora caninum Liverpool]CEL66819.1 TPA: DNA mismatch repair protein mutS, related [Neospora caninum Liverpool]|eukprot:XP_003882871.1 DNA mismatch repair protein mutS, related [Neospora caninum Liverpool]